MNKSNIYFSVVHWILFLLIIPFINIYGAQYRVISNGLNVRCEPNNKATIIGILKNGDTLTVTNEVGKWAKVTIDQKEGYVYKKLIKKVEDKKNIDTEKPGFTKGFKGRFIEIFICSFFILAVIFAFKNRTPDKRFKVGYRINNYSFRDKLLIFLYSVAISILIKLFIGIIT
jgi:hypothetical protein